MRDLRYALRLIAKSPWLSLVAVLSLALGLGANTTIFAFANRLLLQRPPVAHASRLIEIYTRDPDPRAALNGDYPLSYPDYLSFLHRARSLSGLLAYSPLNQVNVVTAPDASTQPWTGELVTGGYFHVLGLRPFIGRWFLPGEDTVNGSSPVVVLSYAAWKTQFGGASNILGRTIAMNGAPYTVIGVAPENFHGLFGGVECDFWAPVTMSDHLGEPGVIEQRAHRALLAVGRLQPGVTLAAANAELNMIQHQLDTQYPKAELATFSGLAVPLGAIPKPFRGSASSIVLLLEVVVGLVLLIACANTALVLLAQALGRQREWALRTALGAGRGRLLRQGLVHSVVLALIAGGVGLGIAELLWPLLLRLRPAGFPLAPPTGLSVGLVAFTIVLALVVGILFGLAPALQATRLRVLDYIKDGTPGAGGVRSRLRSGFIIAQMALCVLVLVGAALCLRSLARARSINPGFDTQHLVLVHDVSPQSLGHTGAAAHPFLLQVRHAVDRLPGVTAAAWIVEVPLQTGEADAMVLPAGASPGAHGEGYRVEVTSVSPDYFQASGTPLLAGRGFTEADLAAGRHLVVINENLARHFWPQGGALGRELTFPGDGTRPPATIVGVAVNGKYHNLNESPRPYMYELDAIATPASLMIHVAGSPASLLPSLRTQLQALDPNLLSANLQTGAAYMQLPLYAARVTGVLLASFGLLALLLAVVGLYGVMATAVTRRTREYGIRMALGAGSGKLLRLVLGQGLRLALWGILAGVILAALLSRYISSLLYGMSPADPVSYLAAAALLMAVTVLASLIPAFRAARVDPLRALRQE